MVISSVCLVSVRLSLQRGGFVPREWLGAKVLLNSQMAKQEAIIGYFEVQPRSLELGGKSPMGRVCWRLHDRLGRLRAKLHYATVVGVGDKV